MLCAVGICPLECELLLPSSAVGSHQWKMKKTFAMRIPNMTSKNFQASLFCSCISNMTNRNHHVSMFCSYIVCGVCASSKSTSRIKVALDWKDLMLAWERPSFCFPTHCSMHVCLNDLPQVSKLGNLFDSCQELLECGRSRIHLFEK
jgi:hypothetical protein